MAVQAQHQYNTENMGLGYCGLSSQEWMMENGGSGNGGGLSFNEQQQLYLSFQQQQLQLQQQQQQQQQMMINQNQQQQQRIMMNQNMGGFGFGFEFGFGFDSNDQAVSSTTCSNNHLLQSMELSQSVLVQVEKQKQEIDRFIAVQNERLRLALHEQRRQQLAVLLTSLETKALNLLRQKDQHLAEATKKAMDLEACLRKTEMENQAWQRVAKENEAMVIALNNTLEQVRENPCCYISGIAEDTGSCCNEKEEEEEEETRESKAAAIDEEGQGENEGTEQEMMKMVCKGCKSRNSCVLFLPCRHLCSCKTCEALLSFCPVCKSVKNSSIEVYMS